MASRRSRERNGARRSRSRRRDRRRPERRRGASSPSSSSGSSKRKISRTPASKFDEVKEPFGSTSSATPKPAEEKVPLPLPATSTPAEVNTGGAYREIPTPGNLIGGLMGRGGATITGIRKNHPGVTIKVNLPAGASMASIIITGDPKMVPSAEVAVVEALMSGPSQGGQKAARGGAMMLPMLHNPTR